MPPLRTAVVGAGAFGSQHARVLAASPRSRLTAVVDADPARAESIAKQYGCAALGDIAELTGKVDAVSLAVPTAAHAEVGAALMEAGIDVLVEKPIASDLPSADRLIEAARRNNRILQVGHLERFNPIVEAAQALAAVPLFFEIQRMNTFSPRSLDVDVVLDLMIHDLDIVLSMVDSPLARLEASGVAILSERADISSVRLIFENGCVANLTASRISVDKVRKLRFFQPRQYVSVDYESQKGALYQVDEQRRVGFQPIHPAKEEPLKRQIDAFLQTVESRNEPRVSGPQGRKTLALALRIVEEMERHSRIVADTLSAGQR